MAHCHSLHYGILNAVQVLEFIDEHSIPLSLDFCCSRLTSKELCGFQHKHVEVENIAFGEKGLICDEPRVIALVDLVAADETVRRERLENVALPLRSNSDAAKDLELVILIGDPESGLEPDVVAEFA